MRGKSKNTGKKNGRFPVRTRRSERVGDGKMNLEEKTGKPTKTLIRKSQVNGIGKWAKENSGKEWGPVEGAERKLKKERSYGLLKKEGKEVV